MAAKRAVKKVVHMKMSILQPELYDRLAEECIERKLSMSRFVTEIVVERLNNKDGYSFELHDGPLLRPLTRDDPKLNGVGLDLTRHPDIKAAIEKETKKRGWPQSRYVTLAIAEHFGYTLDEAYVEPQRVFPPPKKFVKFYANLGKLTPFELEKLHIICEQGGFSVSGFAKTAVLEKLVNEHHIKPAKYRSIKAGKRAQCIRTKPLVVFDFAAGSAEEKVFTDITETGKKRTRSFYVAEAVSEKLAKLPDPDGMTEADR